MKKLIKLSIGFILLFVSIGSVSFFLFHEKEYHIKTKYGDSFIICGGGFSGEYCILNDKSEIIAPVSTFYGKSDLQPICNFDLFRAYSFINDEEEKYIIKNNKSDNYIIIDKNDATYTKYVFESDKGEILKSVFLSDINLMTIVLPYFDQYYHDELVCIAQTLHSENILSLKQYGLTQEMINDKESLDEKIRIMEEYLKEHETELPRKQ